MNRTIRVMGLFALLAGAGAVEAVGPAPGAPKVYIADFMQNGYDGWGGVQVADMLARALSETHRFDIERIASASVDPGALDRAKSGRSGPAWLVEGGIQGFRVVGSNSVGLAGVGFGRSRGNRRLFLGTPGNLAMGSTFAVDGWLRVHDANDGRILGQKKFSSWTIGLHPNYWYNGGPVAQALDRSVVDDRTGAARLVLDLLPLEGRVVSVSAGSPTALVDVGSSRTVTVGERFVVVSPSGGDPVAILRARRAVSATQIEAGVSYPEHGGRSPQPGDLVLSRGW